MNNDGFHRMDDPAFLAERTRVRETIEALQVRMRELNQESTGARVPVAGRVTASPRPVSR